VGPETTGSPRGPGAERGGGGGGGGGGGWRGRRAGPRACRARASCARRRRRGGRRSPQLIWRSDFPPPPPLPGQGSRRWRWRRARRWPARTPQGGAGLSGRKHWAPAISSRSWSQQLPGAGKPRQPLLLGPPPTLALRTSRPGGAAAGPVLSPPAPLACRPSFPTAVGHRATPAGSRRQDGRNTTEGNWLPGTSGVGSLVPAPGSCCHQVPGPQVHTGSQLLWSLIPSTSCWASRGTGKNFSRRL
jgi:hypothetical protein